jgi:hypothetical protein
MLGTEIYLTSQETYSLCWAYFNENQHHSANLCGHLSDLPKLDTICT